MRRYGWAWVLTGGDLAGYAGTLREARSRTHFRGGIIAKGGIVERQADGRYTLKVTSGSKGGRP
jgi:hypothetical protein